MLDLPANQRAHAVVVVRDAGVIQVNLIVQEDSTIAAVESSSVMSEVVMRQCVLQLLVDLGDVVVHFLRMLLRRHKLRDMVGWSLRSLFSTNMAISETKGEW